MPEWRSLANIVDTRARPYLDAEDLGSVFFFEDYLIGKSYDTPNCCNGDIFNLKKDVSKKGTRQWYWRDESIKKFAKDLSLILPEGAYIAHIPESKLRGEAGYCEKFESLYEELEKLGNGYNLLDLFSFKESLPPSHKSGDRNPERIKQNLIMEEWLIANDDIETLYLIDDILTTGGHFTGCKRKIRELSGVPLIGLFWGRSVDPSPFE